MNSNRYNKLFTRSNQEGNTLEIRTNCWVTMEQPTNLQYPQKAALQKKQKAEDLFRRSRKENVRLVTTIMGCWSLGEHAARMGLPHNPRCRSCKLKGSRGIVLHYLCLCTTLMTESALLRAKGIIAFWWSVCLATAQHPFVRLTPLCSITQRAFSSSLLWRRRKKQQIY